jgi:hypothetical protein
LNHTHRCRNNHSQTVSKTVAGLRKARHRGLPKIDWQFTFALAAYNLVRLPALLRVA